MLRKTKRQIFNVEVVGYNECPAKTYVSRSGETQLGRLVPEHCHIVGEVARELVQRFPKRLRTLFPAGAPLVAALHDLGKVSPYFYEKICRACTSRPPNLPEFKALNVQLEAAWGGHAGVSQIAARALGAPEFVSKILGQHHGFSPPVGGRLADDETFGGEPWQNQRALLVRHLMDSLEIQNWPVVESVSQARLVAGLTTVSDWIGSGEFFEDPALAWRDQIIPSIEHAGFLEPSYHFDLSFEEVFGFPPKEVQVQFIESVSGSGSYVLEAPMGIGKTEAALFAAYRLLQKGIAKGIYFALPTQLTSNRIHKRFNQFLERILISPRSHQPLLLHGNAYLLETDLGEEGRPGGAWFQQAKRGLLAPFAVGTVDQALMAAMNVKHGFVRAFGLAGKIVILDEVHTYDSYTGTILDALVKLLVSLECTVLILSATLSSQRRKQILGRTLKGSKAYPMVTAAPRCKDLSEVSLEPPPSRTFEIQMQHETALAIEESLRCAEQGQQVLWIENTVKEAQSVYLNLAARAAEIGVECGLIHSRFTQDHRAFHEDKWVSLYGKDGWSNRVGRGRVLVGTQVLEQSLDIDSDFLVSRFAPTDLLLQRLGRLWRHPNTPRPKGARCRAWWLAPDLGPAVEKPEVAFGPSAFVYSPYVLCRSLEIWEGKLGLSLPQDLRPLVEATYVDREESGQMSRWKQELETGTQRRQGVRALRQLASLTLSEGGVTLSDTETATRYSESESIDVLLLNRLELNPSSKETSFTTVDGAQEVIPWRRHLLSKKGWRKLSVMLMRQVVAIRPAEAPPPLPMETLKKFGLQHCFYLGSPEHTEATLRVALVKRNGQLTHPFGEVLPNWEYRSDLGYRMTSTHGGR